MGMALACQQALTEPPAAARAAGLRYVSDERPGFRRRRCGKGFRYFDTEGRPIKDPDVVKRLHGLAIPPAWTDVWICPLPNGHLQATGRDAKGRKQYRYHSRWRTVRDETKYERMVAFGRALPLIRARVEADLGRPGLPREKVLAVVVRLLESTLIRVGNTEYARSNHSYGLTTLQERHVDIGSTQVCFHFRGKGGKERRVTLRDRRLVRIIRRCRELPGHELFQYVDEEGQRHSIDSADVNAYLQEMTNEDFTAKDFRTWAGTVLAAQTLRETSNFRTKKEAKSNVVRAIETVAKRLGNTPAICRKCYIHPVVIDAYLEGTLLETLQQRAAQTLTEASSQLSSDEAEVLHFIQSRLQKKHHPAAH